MARRRLPAPTSSSTSGSVTEAPCPRPPACAEPKADEPAASHTLSRPPPNSVDRGGRSGRSARVLRRRPNVVGGTGTNALAPTRRGAMVRSAMAFGESIAADETERFGGFADEILALQSARTSETAGETGTRLAR